MHMYIYALLYKQRTPAYDVRKKIFNLKGNFTQTRGITFGYVTRPTCQINIMQNRAKMWLKKKTKPQVLHSLQGQERGKQRGKNTDSGVTQGCLQDLILSVTA